jgi:hypothetical protein
MIDLDSLGASRLKNLPVDLTLVRVLEEFDGPLLAEFQNESTGDKFLYYWCDRDGAITRWMVVRTPTQDLAQYFVNAVNLRDLILKCRDGFVYFLDLDNENRVRSAYYMAVDLLPDEYVPTEQSHYDPSLPINENQQDVFLREDWDSQAIAAEYPRKYVQAYTFSALFGRHGKHDFVAITYKLIGGYVFHTMFASLIEYVQPEKRASLAPSLASDLRQAVVSYLTSRQSIEADAYLLFRWSNDREKMTVSTATNVFVNLCERIGLNGEALLNHSDTIHTAIRALRSYLRRVEYLGLKDQDRMACW